MDFMMTVVVAIGFQNTSESISVFADIIKKSSAIFRRGLFVRDPTGDTNRFYYSCTSFSGNKLIMETPNAREKITRSMSVTNRSPFSTLRIK